MKRFVRTQDGRGGGTHLGTGVLEWMEGRRQEQGTVIRGAQGLEARGRVARTRITRELQKEAEATEDSTNGSCD